MSTAQKSPPVSSPAAGLSEVKYSLPAMLAELKLERASGRFVMEKLDTVEIKKLFKAQPIRRVKSKK